MHLDDVEEGRARPDAEDEGGTLRHEVSTSASRGCLNWPKDSFPAVFCKMLGISVPIALSFTFSLEVFASGAIMGHMSEEDKFIAAITLVSTFMNTILVAGMAPLFAVPVVMSNRMGDYRTALESSLSEDEMDFKRQRISAISASAMKIAGAATPLMFLGLFFARPIATHVFGQDDQVAAIAEDYLSVYAFAVPGVMARMAFEQVILPSGKAHYAMAIGLSTFTIGTLLSLWLGFGGLGVEAMGPRGIAIGYTVESYLIAAIFGALIALHPDLRPFQFFNLYRISQEAAEGVLSDILNWAGPISFTIINELLMTFVVGILAGTLGADDQATMSYMMQLIYLLFVPMAAYGIASQQEVGREVGAGNYEYAKSLARYSIPTALIYLGTPAVAVAAYPEMLKYIIGEASPAVLAKLGVLAPIMCAGVIFDTARYVILQELRSLADPNTSTGISVMGLWSGLVLAGILGHFTDLGVDGIGVGYTLGIGAAMLGLLLRWWGKTEVTHIEQVNELNGNLPSLAQAFCSLFTCGSRAEDSFSAGTGRERLLEDSREGGIGTGRA